MTRRLHSWLTKQSLKMKIAVLSTMVASTAMFIVSIGFILFETSRFKKDLQSEQLVRLNIVGNAIAAALVFDDSATVNDSLSIFQTLPDIETVIVYDADGVAKNKYKQNNGTSYIEDLSKYPIETVAEPGYLYKHNKLISQTPIYVDEDIVGVIASETNLTALKRTVLNYTIIALAVIPIVILLAYALGRYFSQRLTRPIEELAKTMTHVKQTNDYDLRADVGFDNEMGELAENFNEMLMEIRLRDQRLESQTTELLSEKDKAEAGSRAKSEFLANMSHELRTPMNGILGMTEVLLKSGLQENQQQFAEIIHRSGSALTTILNDILDFSKIEADKLDLEMEPFEIETMISDVINLLHNEALSKDIDLIVNTNPNLQKMAIGDAGRIRQVLTNIIGNAIKFTNVGSVTLDVRGKTEEGRYKLSMSVTDTGIGIPANKLDLIFQKFTQAENSTTRDYGGTGLGLAITRSLVEMMGGKIGARAEQGKGSTFWFDIMLDTYEAPTQQETLADARDIQILIISHNVKNCNVLQRQLLGKRIDVTVHEHGTSALQHLKQNVSKNTQNPIIIIEDSKHGIDALSMLDRFKTDSFTKGARYLVLRSDSNEKKTARFARYKNVTTLSAPVNIKALVASIHKILTGAQKATLKAKFVQPRPAAPKSAPSKPAKSEATPRATKPVITPPAPVETSPPSADVISIPDKKTVGKPRILVAEDNQVNRIVMENMLDTDRYDVTFRFDGKEAIEAHQATPYDIILMDISMPVMNGKQATKAIRAMEKRDEKPAVPIIAVTAHAMKSDRDSYLAIGMSDYLSKPISRDGLTSMLEKWIDDSPESASQQKLQRMA